jgi:hypothetical protein
MFRADASPNLEQMNFSDMDCPVLIENVAPFLDKNKI